LDGSLYALSFAQRFSDTRSWRNENGGSWFTQYPFGRANPGARDAAYYVDAGAGVGTPNYDPFSISDGNVLRIDAQPATHIRGLSPADIYGHEFVSGVLSTNGPKSSAGFSQRFGFYEVSAKLPGGQGVWPAFWMLDAHGARAEVDVFELLGQDRSTIYQSVHYANGDGESHPTHVDFDPTAGFHRYGVLITPTVDDYYIDGVRTHSERDASVGEFYFMLSVQIGAPDSWPGPPDETTPWPASLYLQYFRAYRPTAVSC
jgi:beta-glucanase (GH16 family)